MPLSSVGNQLGCVYENLCEIYFYIIDNLK